MEDRGWDGWQALLTTKNGLVVNSAGNEVHFTGVAWAGQAGVPVGSADLRRRQVSYLSGACLAVKADAFHAIDGFAPSFFLYHEDLDLSLRLRLSGRRLGLEPSARVEHEYEFAKGAHKWRLMELNRWATIIRCWPTALLLAILPVLVLTEIGIWLAAFSGGWASQKLRASTEGLGRLGEWFNARRSIQSNRSVTVSEFASWLTPALSSQYLGRVGQSKFLLVGLRAYWRCVTSLLSKR